MLLVIQHHQMQVVLQYFQQLHQQEVEKVDQQEFPLQVPQLLKQEDQVVEVVVVIQDNQVEQETHLQQVRLKVIVEDLVIHPHHMVEVEVVELVELVQQELQGQDNQVEQD